MSTRSFSLPVKCVNDNPSDHNSLLSYRRILEGKSRQEDRTSVQDDSPTKKRMSIDMLNTERINEEDHIDSDRLRRCKSNSYGRFKNESPQSGTPVAGGRGSLSNDQDGMSDLFDEREREQEELQNRSYRLREKKKTVHDELISLEETLKRIEQRKVKLHEEYIGVEIEQEGLDTLISEIQKSMTSPGSTTIEKKNTIYSAPLRRQIFSNPFDCSNQSFDKAHDGSVLCLNLVSSNYAITGGADNMVKIWDMDSSHPKGMHCFQGHTGWVHSVVSDMGLHQDIDLDFMDDYIKQLPPSSDYDDSSSTDSSNSGSSIGNFEDICPYVISGGGDETVRVWDVHNRSQQQLLCGHSGGVLVVRCDPHTIISGSVDKTIRLWDRETGRCMQTLQGSESYVKTLQFLSYALISGGGDGIMRLWDLRSGKFFRTINAHVGSSLNVLQFDAERIVTGGRDGKINVFELGSGKILDSLNVGSSITSLQFIKDRLIFAAHRTTPIMYDMKSKSTVREFIGHKGIISDLQFNRKRLITASWDCSMKSWSIEHQL